MNVFQAYITKLSEFFPIILFVWMYRITNGWYYAFLVGGISALIQISVFIFLRLDLNRFIVAVNLFLFGGALGMVTNNMTILNFYEYFAQTTLFIWLFIVGCITTLFSKRGFIDISASRRIVLANSVYLLLATGAALGFSYIFRGNMILAGGLPFIGVIVLSNILKDRIKSINI